MNVVVFVEPRQNGIVRLSLIDIETKRELPETHIIIPLKEIYKAQVDLVSFWRDRLLQEVKRINLNQPRPLEALSYDGTLLPVEFNSKQLYKLEAPVRTLCCGATFFSSTKVELLDKFEDNKANVLIQKCSHVVNLMHFIRNSKYIGVSE